MILCDTNILISAFNGRLDKIGIDNILIPSMTVMELYRGMSNKKELADMKKSCGCMMYYTLTKLLH
jgi:predicted nucleic acid-binding protein